MQEGKHPLYRFRGEGESELCQLAAGFCAVILDGSSLSDEEGLELLNFLPELIVRVV